MKTHIDGKRLINLMGLLAMMGACSPSESLPDVEAGAQEVSKDLAQAMLEHLKENALRPVSADEAAAMLRLHEVDATAGLVSRCSSFTFSTLPATSLESCIRSNGVVSMEVNSAGPLHHNFDWAALSVVDVTTKTASWPRVQIVPLGALKVPVSFAFPPSPGHTYRASAALHDTHQTLPAGWYYPTLSPSMDF